VDGAERETDARILNAAYHLWREGGLPAVTTRGVAARAGVNEVTLFRHFANKENLLVAMVEQAVGGSVEAPADADAPYDLESDLLRLARMYLGRSAPIGDVILLGLVEARSKPELARSCTRIPEVLTSALTEQLQRQHAAGRLPEAPFDEIARVFFASLFAHGVTAHLRPETDLDQVAGMTARACAAAVRGSAARPAQEDPDSHSGGEPRV